MAGSMEQAGPVDKEGPAWGGPAWQARRLLRQVRVGTLASAAAGGQPFASLVTPGCDQNLSILLLLSDLSEHTRHLRAEPRCALLVAGPPETANPQTAPRLTVTGLAAPLDDPRAKARWLALHPYATLYADFADFSLWRIEPAAGLFVGGFARASRLSRAALLPDPESVARLASAEDGIMTHCNNDHPDALEAIARAAGGEGDGWRMVAVDTDGCDLARREQVLRVHWQAPVADAGGVRAELVRFAAIARGGTGQ